MPTRQEYYSLLGDTRGFIAFVFAADIFLAAAYLFLFLYGNPIGSDKPGLFDLAGEANIPAWYSATKLLVVALCIYFYGRFILLRDKVAGWVILAGAALFAYLSMDESGQLHERFGHRVDLLVLGGGGRSETRFQETGMWMFFLGPALLLALVGGVVYLRKCLSIRSDVFVKALAGVVIFVGAAAPGDFMANYVSGDTSTIQTAAEEFGEMVGVTLIMWAAMTLLAQRQPIVVSEVSPSPRAPVCSRSSRRIWGSLHGQE